MALHGAWCAAFSSGVVPNGPWLFNVAKQSHNYSTAMVEEFCHEGSPYGNYDIIFDHFSRMSQL